jgi:purine-binding chemotaxis protein CheW
VTSGGSGNAPALGLVMRAASVSCFIPTRLVREVMRPLPIEPFAGAPSFVLGASVVRGAPVPVVHLAALLGLRAPGAPTRFVSLNVAGRSVALAVDEVSGVRSLSVARSVSMPPLLRGAHPDAVESIGALDAELLVVLGSAQIVADDLWPHLAVEASS